MWIGSPDCSLVGGPQSRALRQAQASEGQETDRPEPPWLQTNFTLRADPTSGVVYSRNRDRGSYASGVAALAYQGLYRAHAMVWCPKVPAGRKRRLNVELREAIRRANQILVEERSSPTVRYSLKLKELKPNDSLGAALSMLATINEPQMLQIIRARRPREIVEDPNKWAFESVNYGLLCALLSRLPADSCPAFLAAVLGRLVTPPGSEKSKKDIQPKWNGLVSEFPLVAEFCVRNGAKDVFLRTLGEANLTPGHAVLLRHIEDMIALNFTVFTERDYDLLTGATTALGNAARIQLKACRDIGAVVGDNAALYAEIITATDAIKEECRKARYLYVKGELQEGLNLEVNQDKAVVESFLKGQGLSDELIESLNRADQLYHGASTKFEFKSAMGHLRSFMERLHSEELVRLGASGANSIGWGDGVELLHRQAVLTKAEKGYAIALYTLLSDEGVHPIIAEKEYARLARNVVVEYALLFLSKLQKLGHAPASKGGNL